MIRVILAVAGGLALLAIAAYAGIWIAGERILAKTYHLPDAGVAAAEGPEAIANGERLSRIYGCSGCHREGLKGGVFGEAPFIYRAVAPNLPRLAKTYSDDDFERAIRHGVSKNGRSVNGMPSASFYHLRDNELANILAYVRSLPDAGETMRGSEVRILGRLELIRGLFPPDASTIDHSAPRRAFDDADPLQRGEYLALMACSECHGLDFAGEGSDIPGTVPDLQIAAAYPLEDFRVVMRTGAPLGGRDLQLMDEVAVGRFVYFTDPEIDALHAFLVRRGLISAP